ncbi:lamin tail domain-containing protein [Saccharicrinis sp. 156]|uniref:lamin tail domain-containing protein n=1 Tax=Saccharicrinis sp. 156 TaxID=3417574 RepID=UPI003D332DDC
MKQILLFIAAVIISAGAFGQIYINEIDADQTGTDAAEFVELYNAGSSAVSLDGYVLVLFNGSDNASYEAIDLDNYSIPANGYFVIGSTGMGTNIELSPGSSGWLQNGADAVALYQGNAADFGNDTPVTTVNLVDAVVYDTNDSDDAELLVLLNAGEAQLDEAGGGAKDTQSLQRSPDGSGGQRNTSSFITAEPTPGAANVHVSGTVELTYPNGGEIFSAGQDVTITWNSSGITEVVFDIFTSEGSWEELIADPVDATVGSLDFSIPLNAWNWNGYIIRIAAYGSTTINDESDATFTVNGHDTEIFWEDFGDGNLGYFEAISVSGAEVWEYGEFSGKTFARIGGNSNDNEDWLITPAIDLEGTTDETLEFETAVDTYLDNLVVKYSSDYNGLGDPAGATWVELSSYELSEGSWAFKTSISDIGNLSGTVYFAFIYTSDAISYNIWEVTDIYISGIDDGTTDITEAISDVSVFPNPFNAQITVTADAIAKVEVMNVVGQVVVQVEANRMPEVVVPVGSLVKGIYIVKVTEVNGHIFTKKVIKK